MTKEKTHMFFTFFVLTWDQQRCPERPWGIRAHWFYCLLEAGAPHFAFEHLSELSAGACTGSFQVARQIWPFSNPKFVLRSLGCSNTPCWSLDQWPQTIQAAG